MLTRPSASATGQACGSTWRTRQAHSDAPAATRSQAANLLGILVVRDSLLAGNTDGIPRATRLFQRAIYLAPDNDSAKFNLELVLSLPGSKGKSKTAQTAGGGRGAGTDAPGSGY